MRWTAIVLASLFGLLVLAGIVVRFGAQTPAGRAFVAGRLEGLKLGPVGKLHVEGLQGDIFGDFGFKRLAIVDSKGMWLDARGVRVRWDWLGLLVRRVQIDTLQASNVQVARPPAIEPTTPGAAVRLPVTINLSRIALRLETLPAISVQHGLFDVTGSLKIGRRLSFKGDIHGRSLGHPGDGLDGRFNVGFGKRLLIDAQAREAKGGAIAGLAGLAADKTFLLDAHADGAPDQGRLHLRMLSGADSVAQAEGGWTQAGGSGQGRVSLAASRWTAGFMRMFGPELRLTGAGKGLGHNLYDLTLQGVSDNATISLAGELDANKLASPKGLKVQASVGDLSRIVAQPAMGRAGVSGLLSGGGASWKLAGAVTVDKLATTDYSLSRVAGPAELDYLKGEWRLKANLTGAGGQGKGLIAALAGAAPKAIFDGSRLADGRLLLRSLQANGVGLKIDATGERTLFGALNFKGQAQFSNLQAAYAGAKGAIATKWSASQGKAGAPWNFTADANGSGLALGRAEVDRLLGPKPALHMAAAWDKGLISVNKAVLDGAAAHAQGSGQISKAGELKLSINWTASGPFTAGPLEIAGQAKGAGAITGTFALPRADLMADFERIDLPQLSLKPAHVILTLIRSKSGVDGLINIMAGSDYGVAHGKAGLHFVSDGLSLTDIDAAAGGATAAGSLALHNNQPSSADLTLAVGPGAFLAEGHAQARVKITDQPGGATGDIKLTAQDVVAKGSTLTVTQANFNANGPLARLPYTLSAEAQAQNWPVKLDGSGVLSQAGGGYAASFSGSGQVRKAAFRTISPAAITIDGPRRSARLDLTLGGGQANIVAEQTAETVNAKAALANVDLAALGEDLAGKVSANLSVNGSGANLGGVLDAQLKGVRTSDAPAKLALDGAVHAVLAGGSINLNASATGVTAGEKANVALVLPAETSAAPFRIAIARTKPIQGRFDANGELAPIWNLFYGGEQSLGGVMSAQGAIAGTLNVPKLTGHATLASGRFDDASTGLKLRNLAADVDLSQTEVDVRNFSGTDIKSGTVAGSGSFSLAAGGQSTLTLNVKNFQLLDNEDAKASATGAVTVTRASDNKFKLAGALTIDQADISPTTRTPPGVVTMDVVEKNRPKGQQTGMQVDTSAHAPDIALDIRLRAPGRIYVRGLGLNAELSLNATVSGSIASPVLSGEARVVRGDYDFAGKRFQIDNQGEVILATSPDQIRLNLSATWDDSASLTAVIKITGTASKPKIALTSTPVLPQDEILSQVLFGSSAAQLSPVEAAQLAAAVTALATGGGFDVMGGLSRFARLDRLALGGDEASGVTVSGGKYIGNHLYLELTGGGRYGPSAEVEYRANRSFSLISTVGGLGGAKLSVRWRHDYGKATDAAKPAKK